MLFLKRLLVTIALVIGFSIVVSAVLWACGYFIHFTRAGQEITISAGAAPAGLIAFLILVVSAWLSTRIFRRPAEERERERNAA